MFIPVLTFKYVVYNILIFRKPFPSLHTYNTQHMNSNSTQSTAHAMRCIQTEALAVKCTLENISIRKNLSHCQTKHVSSTGNAITTYTLNKYIYMQILFVVILRYLVWHVRLLLQVFRVSKLDVIRYQPIKLWNYDFGLTHCTKNERTILYEVYTALSKSTCSKSLKSWFYCMLHII